MIKGFILYNVNNRNLSGKGVLQQGSGEVVEATAIRKGHTDVVEDVAGHNHIEKFLIGKDSKVIARFKPGVKPFDENLIAAIEVALDS
mgnify:CR=1 FL=1